jgi:hypothetical protein
MKFFELRVYETLSQYLKVVPVSLTPSTFQLFYCLAPTVYESDTVIEFLKKTLTTCTHLGSQLTIMTLGGERYVEI